MDIRNVQKTGSMFYVYLPTSWVKQFNIKAGTKVSTHQKNDGTLSLNPQIKERELQKLNLNLSKENMHNINKLIVACYVNPLKSFSINLEEELDISKLLLQKKLLSVEMVEFDGKHITCKSPFSVDDPLSLLKTMIKKIKNLLYVMRKNYNKELIERYEEEIDRSKLHVSKSVIGMLTHSKPSTYKIIELHYMEIIARDLEKLVDHLKEIPGSETKYLSTIDKAITCLDNQFTALEKRSDDLPYTNAMEFAKKAGDVPFQKVKDELTYHKIRVKAAFEAISENLVNWSITEEIYKKTK